MQTPKIEFFDEKRYALIEIARPQIVDDLKSVAEADGFEEKEEFHVTVLPGLETFSEDDLKELPAYRTILQGREVDDIQVISDAIYRINKPKVVDGKLYERESIIARIRSDKILRMLGEGMLNGYGIHAPIPFLHVTLFTKGDSAIARHGIGIDSVAEFRKLFPQQYPPQDY